MSSVTGRIKEIKQPRGGYLNPKIFQKIQLEDEKKLNIEENVHSSIIGMAVDYMTRYLMGTPLKDAFSVSLSGAYRAELLTKGIQCKEAKKLLEEIKGIDNNSIICTCKLVSFDVWARNPIGALVSPTYNEINPDIKTIENIKIMIERSLNFWDKYGPIVEDGFHFSPNGYTEVVDTGDGDYLSKDTIWDFKVSKNDITNKHTLQLLMYYIMGKHSGNKIFKDINKLGFFNPRLNKVYILDVTDISNDVILSVEKDVIGYK